MVYVSDESSDPVHLIYGVPQGSILGSMEFTAYMCPIYDVAQKHGISIHQYIDDMQFYLAFGLTKQEVAIAKMEACLNDIRIWMRQTNSSPMKTRQSSSSSLQQDMPAKSS